MPADLPVTVIEFQLRGRPGHVLVRYGTNQDPERWGYPLLGLGSLAETSRGFHVVQEDVEHDAEGYGAVLAWIQIVRSDDLDSGAHTALVDHPPQLAGLDLPYAYFGTRPTFFDAPSTDASRNVDWHAQATLVASPDCVMTRRVRGLCAFGWGYRLREGRPDPLPVRELGDPAWREDRAFQTEQHPRGRSSRRGLLERAAGAASGTADVVERPGGRSTTPRSTPAITS
jgi:hypothetical protein